MSDSHGTFFTSIGCMDGRVQSVIAKFGLEKFEAQYPDTITEAGCDGLLARSNDQRLLDSIKSKLLISVEKHNSKGVIVHGHEDCAGNPVDKDHHKEHIRQTVEKIKQMLGAHKLEIIGVYVSLSEEPAVELV